MIYVDFDESILVPEDNVKQNPNESYTSKYQKHVACSYGTTCTNKYQKHVACSQYFIGSMIKKSKYCSNVMKKHFNKVLAMTKKDNEDFENSTKCQICDNDYTDNDVKVKDHCHITGKCRGSVISMLK